MRNYILTTITLSCVLFSCNHIEHELDSTPFDCTIETRSEIIGEEQKNSYHIDSMQVCFNNYLKQKGISDYIRLQPTHIALRLNAKTMEEIHSIERDPSLVISDIPFDSIPETDNRMNDLLNSDKVAPSYINGNLTTEDTIEECSIHSNNQEEILIRPLYILWPIEKALPEDINYELLYYAFVPEVVEKKSNLPKNITEWLKFGNRAYNNIYDGYLYGYDNVLSQNVPIRNATIRISGYGAMTVETDDTGHFNLPGGIDVSNVSLTLFLKNDNFIVRNGSTSAVYNISLGTVTSLWGNNTSTNIYLPNNFAVNIYQAAWYYFNESNSLLNSITKYHSSTSTPLDIHAIDSYHGYYGAFYYSENGTYLQEPYINIYNYSSTSSYIFGTVLHELGHATYYTMEGVSSIDSTKDFIHESFASFFGWYNVLNYYSTVAASHAAVNSICSQGRQLWTPSSINIDYTPLYIDLFDTLNQYTYYNQTSLVNDSVSNVPISVIISAALGPANLTDVNNLLNNYIGVYYNQSSYDSFIANYFSANFN